jgi:hypothetical protein
MLSSLKDESLPADFKDMVREKGIDDDYLATILDESPKALFEFFDGQNIYVEICVEPQASKDPVFKYTIYNTLGSIMNDADSYNNRKGAETFAIWNAFQILNEKL